MSGDGKALAAANYQDSSIAVGINGDPNDTSSEDAGAVYLFEFNGSTWPERAYIKSSNTETKDYFGASISFSFDANALAISAPHEDSGATDIMGDQTDNSAESAGAVYIY